MGPKCVEHHTVKLNLTLFRQCRHPETHPAQVMSTRRLTVGNVGDLTEDVVPAYLFVAFWWAHQCLADHGDVDFGTNAAVGWLEGGQEEKCEGKFKCANTSFTLKQSFKWNFSPPPHTLRGHI